MPILQVSLFGLGRRQTQQAIAANPALQANIDELNTETVSDITHLKFDKLKPGHIQAKDSGYFAEMARKRPDLVRDLLNGGESINAPFVILDNGHVELRRLMTPAERLYYTNPNIAAGIGALYDGDAKAADEYLHKSTVLALNGTDNSVSDLTHLNFTYNADKKRIEAGSGEIERMEKDHLPLVTSLLNHGDTSATAPFRITEGHVVLTRPLRPDEWKYYTDPNIAAGIGEVYNGNPDKAESYLQAYHAAINAKEPGKAAAPASHTPTPLDKQYAELSALAEKQDKVVAELKQQINTLQKQIDAAKEAQAKASEAMATPSATAPTPATPVPATPAIILQTHVQIPEAQGTTPAQIAPVAPEVKPVTSTAPAKTAPVPKPASSEQLTAAKIRNAEAEVMLEVILKNDPNHSVTHDINARGFGIDGMKGKDLTAAIKDIQAYHKDNNPSGALNDATFKFITHDFQELEKTLGRDIGHTSSMDKPTLDRIKEEMKGLNIKVSPGILDNAQPGASPNALSPQKGQRPPVG